jgi:hypothetical protein
MAATKLQMNGYGAVLESLRDHRQKIDRAIQALEALQNSDIPPLEFFDEPELKTRGSGGSYVGLQFIDAVKKLFARTNGPLTTTQISEALINGGFSSESENPKKVIAAQLHRYAGNDESGIVKHARGVWVLDDRSRRKSV